METDRSQLCGCKGIRTCLKCEKLFDIPSKPVALNTEEYKTYFYCLLCNACYPGLDSSENPHPDHIGTPIHLQGIYVKVEFLTKSEEEELFNALEALPWDPSQSGRRKQNFGPKCNFKKRKIKVGDFKGFPQSTKFVQEKLRQVPLLSDFQTIEQCTLEYDPERGASIDPHIDDCWIWGERIVTVNLLADSALTLTPYLGDEKKYNLPLAPQEYCLTDCQDPIAVRVPMPRRSLIVLTRQARYSWEHQVFRDDIKERRLCLAYREFTPPYLPGGEREELGAETLQKAKLFCILQDAEEVFLVGRICEELVVGYLEEVLEAVWLAPVVAALFSMVKLDDGCVLKRHIDQLRSSGVEEEDIETEPQPDPQNRQRGNQTTFGPGDIRVSEQARREQQQQQPATLPPIPPPSPESPALRRSDRP